MKQKDQGIVLKKIPYSENSLILTFFCREAGLKTFLFQGGKKKKGNSLFPLRVIELEYYARNDSTLAKLSNIDTAIHTTSNLTHPIKSALLFFFAEMLQNLLHYDQKDEAFFLFLATEFHAFDVNPYQANYPIWFMLELTKWLGVEPQVESESSSFFEGENGLITDSSPATSQKIIASGEHIQALAFMLKNSKEKAMQLPLTAAIRNKAVRSLLHYFSLHFSSFSSLKSLEVLEEVWS